MVMEEARTVFLYAHLFFVIWALFRWAYSRTSQRASLRSRMGSIGLIAGSSSAVLLALFYIYVWIAHKLPAQGLALWSLVLVGGFGDRGHDCSVVRDRVGAAIRFSYFP